MSSADSPLPFAAPALAHYQHASTDDIAAGTPAPAWYHSGVPVNDHYDPASYTNPYVTPQSMPLGGFSPLPELPKAADTPMLNFPSSSSDTLSTYTNVTEPYSVDYLKADTTPQFEVPKLSIPPPFLDFPRPDLPASHYNKANESSIPYGFAPYDSLQLPPRPRSSPSVFSPAVPFGGRMADAFAWPLNPLGITHAGFDESVFHTAPHQAPLASSPPQTTHNTPEMHAPQPRRTYHPIAPHPMSLQRMNVRKRTQDDDDASDSTLKRRKTSTSSSNAPVELSEEDRLLIKLKDEENLPWKDIAARFQTERGKSYQIPALQMRLKRLKERLRVWTDADVTALRKAHDYWRDNKFEIIAQKMIEFGATDKWAAKQVARKWAEIDPTATPFITHDDGPQSYSYTTSPVEQPRMMPFLGLP